MFIHVAFNCLESISHCFVLFFVVSTLRYYLLLQPSLFSQMVPFPIHLISPPSFSSGLHIFPFYSLYPLNVLGELYQKEFFSFGDIFSLSLRFPLLPLFVLAPSSLLISLSLCLTTHKINCKMSGQLSQEG